MAVVTDVAVCLSCTVQLSFLPVLLVSCSCLQSIPWYVMGTPLVHLVFFKGKSVLWVGEARPLTSVNKMEGLLHQRILSMLSISAITFLIVWVRRSHGHWRKIRAHLFMVNPWSSSTLKSPRSPPGVPTHVAQRIAMRAYLRETLHTCVHTIHTHTHTHHANCNGEVTENVSYLPFGNISLHILGASSVKRSNFREGSLCTASSGQWKSS